MKSRNCCNFIFSGLQKKFSNKRPSNEIVHDQAAIGFFWIPEIPLCCKVDTDCLHETSFRSLGEGIEALYSHLGTAGMGMEGTVGSGEH